MNKYLRRASIGLLGGLAACYPLAVTQETQIAGFALGILCGLAYALVFRPSQGAYADSAMTAAALGVPAGLVKRACERPVRLADWTHPVRGGDRVAVRSHRSRVGAIHD